MRNTLRLVACPKAGVLLALLGGSLLAPPAARAGCDWPTHIDPANPAARPTSDHRAVPPVPAPAVPETPCPCQGPTCSRAPFVPPVPPLVVALKFQEWGCPALCPRPAPCLLTAYLRDEVPQLPVRRGSTVYRPPRPLA